MVMDSLLELLLIDGYAPTEQASVRLAYDEYLLLRAAMRTFIDA